ncbi:MAG: MoxR family ATPase [Deltaproteobacteria bacterium]|nr:MoxR family ATPase [Deltaproteobacteria bacterium]
MASRSARCVSPCDLGWTWRARLGRSRRTIPSRAAPRSSVHCRSSLRVGPNLNGRRSSGQDFAQRRTGRSEENKGVLVVHLNEVTQRFEEIENEVRRVFVGQDDVVSSVLAAIFARGHVLLEGVPGVGKTLLVRTLGIVLGCHFRRVQFTPDLMPSDVTGSTLYNSQKGAFEFKHGPVFTHLLLADEVNRAPAKTQSAMLEAMAERSVTVDGTTHPLPEPFFVLATQNPLESAGTYALPEAQLDRFLFKVLIDHPSIELEEQLLRNVRDGFDASRLEAMQLVQCATPDVVVAMQEAIATDVRIDDQIISYIAALLASTRRHRAVQIGASPRAGIALLQVSRVEAAMQGRAFVVPDDVKMHGRAVLRHRLILQPDAEIEGMTTDEVIEGVLHDTQVPGMGQGGPASRAAAPRGTPRVASVAGQAGDRTQVPSDVTLLNVDAVPEGKRPSHSTHAPQGSGRARPAGLDPDTIPPPAYRPLRSAPSARASGSDVDDEEER